jgi:hypothetical protein
MNLEKIEDEIIQNGNRKVNIGVRVYPEEKLNLIDAAKAVQVSLSEYCENILITQPALLEEVNNLTYQVEDLKQKNANLENSLASNEPLKLKININTLFEENALLKKNIEELNLNHEIYSDSRLAYLFKEVKGQRDTIITDAGEMNITFNTPKDVLLALIYSHTL